MSALMAQKRPRLTLEMDEEVIDALRLEAAFRSVEHTDLARQILKDALGEAIAQIRSRRQAEKKKHRE